MPSVKRTLFLLVILLRMDRADAQLSHELVHVLLKLDSIRNTNSVSSHFADVYFETTSNAISFFRQSDSSVQRMICRLQCRFAEFFFKAADAYNNGGNISPEWQAYYSDSNSTSTQLLLYGINAHVNGDIWKAITAEFTASEMKLLRPHYIKYQKGLLEIYKNVYTKCASDNKRLRFLRSTAFGFDNWYGRFLLKRWRKRQWMLAEFYNNDPQRFQLLLKKVEQRMQGLNQLIRKNI